MTYSNQLAIGLTTVIFIGAALSPVLKAENGGEETGQMPFVTPAQDSRAEVETIMLRFAEYKIKQMDELAARLNIQIPDEFKRIGQSILENTSWDNVADQYGKLRFRSGQYTDGKCDPTISTALWSGPILELYGAYEQAKNWEPDILKLYADLILKDLPAGSIFMGGTDAGRFVPTMFRYGYGSPDVYIITQNALADNNYEEYIRTIYGQTIKLPTPQDINRVFQSYVEDIRAGRIPKNANVTVDKEGKASVQGVQGVMEINGIISKAIFDMNKAKHAFYVEESYVIAWMYPYLVQHGIIMQLMPDKVTLTDEIISNDTRYWEALCQELVSRADFGKDVMAKKAFSKMRCAQAGIYAFHRRYDLAEAAFKQALDLCSVSPEANFRLADCYLKQGKKKEAREVMAHYLSLEPGNAKAEEFLKQTN